MFSQSFTEFRRINCSVVEVSKILSKRNIREKKSIMDTGHRTYLPNPSDSAGILSKIFYIWTIPLFRKGYAKILELSDVYQPLRVDRSETLGQRLEQ